LRKPGPRALGARGGLIAYGSKSGGTICRHAL
jgi:hypothetical protein